MVEVVSTEGESLLRGWMISQKNIKQSQRSQPFRYLYRKFGS